MLSWTVTPIQEGIDAQFQMFVSRRVVRWGLGPRAKLKKQLIADGKLDKYGRKNENTPKDWGKVSSDAFMADIFSCDNLDLS